MARTAAQKGMMATASRRSDVAAANWEADGEGEGQDGQLRRQPPSGGGRGEGDDDDVAEQDDLGGVGDTSWTPKRTTRSPTGPPIRASRLLGRAEASRMTVDHGTQTRPKIRNKRRLVARQAREERADGSDHHGHGDPDAGHQVDRGDVEGAGDGRDALRPQAWRPGRAPAGASPARPLPPTATGGRACSVAVCGAVTGRSSLRRRHHGHDHDGGGGEQGGAHRPGPGGPAPRGADRRVPGGRRSPQTTVASSATVAMTSSTPTGSTARHRARGGCRSVRVAAHSDDHGHAAGDAGQQGPPRRPPQQDGPEPDLGGGGRQEEGPVEPGLAEVARASPPGGWRRRRRRRGPRPGARRPRGEATLRPGPSRGRPRGAGAVVGQARTTTTARTQPTSTISVDEMATENARRRHDRHAQ